MVADENLQPGGDTDHSAKNQRRAREPGERSIRGLPTSPPAGSICDIAPPRGEISTLQSSYVNGPFVIQSHSTDDSAYQEALGFLYGRINYEQMTSGSSRFPFRLQRTSELLRALGLADYLHTQTTRPKVPIVHIAGTKGKGSTACMVAASLTSAGLKTGLYTSPHLHRLEERFQIDGEPCSSGELVALVQQIRPATESVADPRHRPPSFFELITAIALLHFDRCDCDAIVLEVGLGGRLGQHQCVRSQRDRDHVDRSRPPTHSRRHDGSDRRRESWHLQSECAPGQRG